MLLITRAALFWKFTSLSSNAELQLPTDNTTEIKMN